MKLGYLSIKNLFDTRVFRYKKFNINDNAYLKVDFERIPILKKDVTISLLDIEDFFLSYKLSMVEKALKYFSQNLLVKDKARVLEAFEILKFWI